MTVKTISHGIAECKYEPRGDHGLEGYLLSELYYFERCTLRGDEYMRVFPADIEKNWTIEECFLACVNYYETCGVGVFSKYFKIKAERNC